MNVDNVPDTLLYSKCVLEIGIVQILLPSPHLIAQLSHCPCFCLRPCHLCLNLCKSLIMGLPASNSSPQSCQSVVFFSKCKYDLLQGSAPFRVAPHSIQVNCRSDWEHGVFPYFHFRLIFANSEGKPLVFIYFLRPRLC